MLNFVTYSFPFLLLIGCLLFRHRKLDLALAISGSLFFNIIGYVIAVCLAFIAGGSFIFSFAGYNQEGGYDSPEACITRTFAVMLFSLPIAALALSTWLVMKAHKCSQNLQKISLKKLICFYAFSLFFSISIFLIVGGLRLSIMSHPIKSFYPPVGKLFQARNKSIL